jgi:hypothetical protein
MGAVQRLGLTKLILAPWQLRFESFERLERFEQVEIMLDGRRPSALVSGAED